MSGWLYRPQPRCSASAFIGYAWRLWRHYSDALARQTFRFSIWHLSLLFAALLLDHYLRPWIG
jgi:protoheme IX farnesyltransferase